MKSLFPCSRPVLLASIFSVFQSPFSQASGTVAGEPFELEPVYVVTAYRARENAYEAMASVSVISALDIERSVAQDLLELLRLETGLDVVRGGGAGGQTSVFMRGGNSNHTLVLIDGVRVASAHTGAYAWEQLPLNQVERIEIVRGPRASLFGSDAIGGVIQIFTRQADGPNYRATAGSFSTTEFEAGSGFSLGDARISLSAGYRDSDGFSSQNGNGFSYHPDSDGFQSRNLALTGSGGSADDSWQFRVFALDNEVEFDQGISVTEQVSFAASREGKLANGWGYRVSAGYTDDQLGSDFIFFTTGFESRRLEIDWQNRLPFERGNLAFGIDFYEESGKSALTYDEDRHNIAAFAMWDQALGHHTRLQISTRLDDNSLFGSEFTHQAALRFKAGHGGEILGFWGTAFRAPTLSEQYSPGFGGLFAGNPLLQPESSDSFELMYRLSIGDSGRVSISAYQTDVESLIAFSGKDFQAVNINEAELRGLELEYSLERARWLFNTNATLQHTEDRFTGTSLLRRPDRKASLSINRDFENGSWLGAEWFVSGERLDFGGQTLPGYALLNLAAGYRLSTALSLELRLDNLLDHDYEPASGFNSAERSAFLSLNWSPGP
jgi:vitamin B12 transporter